MHKVFCFLFLFLGFKIFVTGSDLPRTEQLIVVTTEGWDAVQGKLNAYEWRNNCWTHRLRNVPVVVGKKGLAWGSGLHDKSLITGPVKREGDGRSPAGIYPLTGLFGYMDLQKKMDYLKVDKNTFCIDDPSSAYYNKVVHSDTVTKDWNSAETMKLKSDNYKYGIFVGYNTDSVRVNSGSCIFIHIWDDKNSPTAGCTALTENNILKLIRLLNKEKNPLLVQAPQKEYEKLKTLYSLP